jgi:hypothetical protein
MGCLIMFLEEFLNVLKQILNELRILNEHFDSKAKSKTIDYDVVFSHWTKDMARRYKGLPLNMHWGRSSPLITKNEILFDVRYKDEYFCEVKYKFDPQFVNQFKNSLLDFYEKFQLISKGFDDFKKNFDYKTNPKIDNFEKEFSNWKKEIYNIVQDVALDIHWDKKDELIEHNAVFFNFMLRDDYLFEMKRRFVDEREELRKSLMDVDEMNDLDDDADQDMKDNELI